MSKRKRSRPYTELSSLSPPPDMSTPNNQLIIPRQLTEGNLNALEANKIFFDGLDNNKLDNHLAQPEGMLHLVFDDLCQIALETSKVASKVSILEGATEA